MSKAEERAKERYWLEPSNIDTQNKYQAYLEGYHQAEKDLELTWEDIETIGELRLNVALELRRKELESPIKAPLKFTIEDMCKEVLKRFKS